MGNLEVWQNGANGATVKKIINNNFKILNECISQNIDIYSMAFKESDWETGSISIPYSQHKKVNPCVEIFIKDDYGYSPVYGGYIIRGLNVELQTDIAYEGKVVIR